MKKQHRSDRHFSITYYSNRLFQDMHSTLERAHKEAEVSFTHQLSSCATPEFSASLQSAGGDGHASCSSYEAKTRDPLHAAGGQQHPPVSGARLSTARRGRPDRVQRPAGGSRDVRHSRSPRTAEEPQRRARRDLRLPAAGERGGVARPEREAPAPRGRGKTKI